MTFVELSRVVIASPNDVKEEREALNAVIARDKLDKRRKERKKS
jgi:hypothetical protein